MDMNTPKTMATEVTWNPDSEASHATGGYSIGFSLTVLQVTLFVFVISHFVCYSYGQSGGLLIWIEKYTNV